MSVFYVMKVSVEVPNTIYLSFMKQKFVLRVSVEVSNKFTMMGFRIIALFLFLGFVEFSYSQCSISSPTGTGGCSFGPGVVNLTASGSTGYYNWYTASTGGSILGTGPTFSTPYIASTTTYHLAATDTNTGLNFDGSNDYIALNYSFTGTSALPQFTAEGWVKTTVSGAGTNDNWSIIDFDRSDFFNLFVNGSDGTVGFATNSTSGGIHDFYSTGVSVNDGNWHHVVGQYTGTDKVIYVDGVEVARSVNPHSGAAIGKNSTRFGFIGDGSEAGSFNSNRNNLYFQGELDEVRLWTTVRTSTEINNYKDSCITTIPAGLILYYPMNENGGTTIDNAAGTGGDGTLYNFGPTAWVHGATVSCTCESTRVPVVATISSSTMTNGLLNCGTSSVSIDAGSGFTGYAWSTGQTTQTISATTAGVYSVTTTGGACNGSRAVSVVGRMHSGLALKFDGNNDYAPIENLSYTGTNGTELTVETWVKTSSSSNQIIASFDRSEFWRLEIGGEGGGSGSGKIGFDINTSTGTKDQGSTTAINDNKWHHVAGVFDNGTIKIYIDGILESTTTGGATYGSSNTRWGFLGTGSEADSYNGTTGPASYFNGEMDEFRVWNVARTETQIRDYMVKQLPTNTSGLVIYYKFDKETGTKIFDYATDQIYDAIMWNFAANPKVPSGVPLGDEVDYLYKASWAAADSISISSCFGENMSITGVTGTISGAYLYYVYSEPNDTTGANYGGNKGYYGVHKIKGPTATYTGIFNYSGNPLVTAQNEAKINLFTRSDNSQIGWTSGGPVLDTVANTLTVTGISTEFAMGGSVDPLPIELMAFEASWLENKVLLEWATASEINNNFFTIERGSNGIDWIEIGEIEGAGFSNSISSYDFIDENPLHGINYYRLRQTDFNGHSTYSGIQIIVSENRPIQKALIYPNPAHNTLLVYGVDLTSSKFKVVNLIGADVTKSIQYSSNSQNENHLDISELQPGSYILRIGRESYRIIKQD